MIEVIHHIVRTSARRDRTEINMAMVDAMEDLFQPISLTIYRCYPGAKKMMVFACAGINREGAYYHNAYLPDKEFCSNIEQIPLLKRCRQEMSVVLEVLDNHAHRLVFPVISHDQPIYMIDITLPEDFSADRRVALMGIVEYFGNHIALLNYGEEDTLTGLASRKTFDKHLFELLGRAAADQQDHNHPAKRRGAQCVNSRHWLAVCDIDKFKSINDTYGHLIGDEVLIMLAQVMHKSFRFDDQLFRFGGEEFVIVLQPASPQNALQALERFRKAVEETIFSRVGHVTISIGFSQLMPNDTPTDVIDRADEALYYAKHNGRNRVDHYEALIEQSELQPKQVNTGDVELF